MSHATICFTSQVFTEDSQLRLGKSHPVHVPRSALVHPIMHLRVQVADAHNVGVDLDPLGRVRG